MTMTMPATAAADPSVPDWNAVDLPDTWPDRANLLRPRLFWRALRCALGARQRVEVPDGLPFALDLPRYLRQEFHNLPNGNYSKGITRSYIVTFDRVMLGRMKSARRRLAAHLVGARVALDVGTGGGRTAATLKQSGVPEVWGIDPSPYMLKHAAADHPDVRFVPGLAERTGFPDARFDAVSVCFVMHEIPIRYVGACLAELWRVLRPGGRLAICEPSAEQLEGSFWRQLRRHGPLRAYYNLLARFVYEPFVRAWHRADVPQMLRATGFQVVGDEQAPPVRYLFAVKPPAPSA